MKNNLNKEEYTILSQNQKSKTYDFNSSFKNRLIHIGYKKLLFILFSLITIIIIVLFISIKFIYGEGSQNKIGIFTRNITNLDFREAPINGSLPLETYTSFENGNSLTYLIINCSPNMLNQAETLSTLRFGQRAKLYI